MKIKKPSLKGTLVCVGGSIVAFAGGFAWLTSAAVVPFLVCLAGSIVAVVAYPYSYFQDNDFN